MTVGKSGMANSIQTPFFAIEASKLERNLTRLVNLGARCGIQVLHTLKAIDTEQVTTMIAKKLDGFSATNKNEIDKIRDCDRGHVHLYSPAFKSDEIHAISSASDTMSFNSLSQYHKYQPIIKDDTSIGIRINPNIQIIQPEYCDASATASRFGVSEDEFLNWFSSAHRDIDGIHFHLFCHQDGDSIRILLKHLRDKYDDVLKKLKWLNLGGGVKLTDDNFDIDQFVDTINRFKQHYPNLNIMIEPGEAVVNRCGYLECSVIDVVARGDEKIAIVDTSIETHLLDIAIVKASPRIRESTSARIGKFNYKIAGVSCIAGDIIGEYCFDSELQIGDRLKIDDVVGYNICKQNEFNGIEKAELYLV